MSHRIEAPMGKSFEIISPQTERTRFSVEYLGPDAAWDRLQTAERAATAARTSSLDDRIKLCRSFLDCYEEELEQNARAISEMMGKPISQARGEFAGMKSRTLALCALAPGALSDEKLERPDGIQRTIVHEPLGVVMDIAAWNYPLLVAINIVAPAVLAGNSVLLKHSPQTALVGAQFERAFRRAGAPEGLVQDFFVDHDLAADIIKSGRLGYLAFTGSVAGGKTVHARAAEGQLLPTGLELGGKDAALVLPDCDFEPTVANLVDGAFYNAGQSCCAVERIYVHRSLYQDFLARFAELSRAYILGDPLAEATNLGPVVNRGTLARLRAQVAGALSQGARLLVGDADFSLPAEGTFMAPHVLSDAPQDSALMQEESFGPVIGIRAFDTEQEAVALANDSQYGLTASVWTRDLEHALTLGRKLNVGTVLSNRADFVDPELPWNGVKDSGLGCSLSSYGLRALTRPKGYHFRA